MGTPIDLMGQRFGRLTVTAQAEAHITTGGERKRCWVCICDCGNTSLATTQDLRKGDKRSCGCLKRDLDVARAIVHGKSGTHLYNVWKAMRRRCSDARQSDYKDYGGRGIRVCEEWSDNYLAFECWALNNGYKNGLTIDRIDTNGNYTPSNCRWATHQEQCNNRRSNVLYENDGVIHNIKTWSEISGIPYNTLYMRLRKHGDIKRALEKN